MLINRANESARRPARHRALSFVSARLGDGFVGDVRQRALEARGRVGRDAEVPRATGQVAERVAGGADACDLDALIETVARGPVIDPVAGEVGERRAVRVVER